MKLLASIALFSFLMGSVAFAQGGAKAGGGTSTGPFEFFMSSGLISLGGSASGFDLSPGLNFKPLAGYQWLQVGGEITYQKLSYQGGSTKTMLIMVGPTFNLSGTSTNDAVFFSLGVALRSGSSDLVMTTTDSPSGTGYYLLVGKRFPLAGGFSYRPTLGIVNAGTSGFVVRPLAISYHF